jgi:hypothetical protein
MDEGVVLASHMRCCSHILDLVATIDAEVALSDHAYKKVHRLSLAKATAIWNAISRLFVDCFTVHQHLGHIEPTPVVIRSTIEGE